MPSRHKYHCEKCDDWFHSRHQLEQHYLDTPSHPSCQKCGLGFADQEEKRYHYYMSGNHEHCIRCEIGFPNITALQKHYLQDENHPVCYGMGFFNEATKTRHFSQSTSHPRCTDPSCNRGFIDIIALNQHLRSTHKHASTPDGSSSATMAGTSNSGDRERCSYYDGEFVSQIALAMHQRDNPLCEAVGPSRNGGQYICHCGSMFEHWIEFKEHKHNSYHYRHYSASFRTRATLGEHLLSNPTHFAPSKFNPKDVKEHSKDKPRSTLPFGEFHRCKHCSANFATRTALEAHLRDNPSHLSQSSISAAKFKCFACGQRFSGMAALKDHHSASQHRNCSICEVGFFALSDLHDHFRESPQHPNCRDCNHGFFDSEAEAYHRQPITYHSNCPKCYHIFPSVCARLEHQCSALPSQAASNIDSGHIKQTPREWESPGALRGVECGACHSHFIHRKYFDLHLQSKSKCMKCLRMFPSECQEKLHQCSGVASAEFPGRDQLVARATIASNPVQLNSSQTPVEVAGSLNNSFGRGDGNKKENQRAKPAQNTSVGDSNFVEAEQTSQQNNTYLKKLFDMLGISEAAHTASQVAHVSRSLQSSTPLEPIDTNAPRATKSHPPLATPSTLNDQLKGLVDGPGNQVGDKKAEPEKKSNVHIRPPLSQKIKCGVCKAVFATNSGMADHMESGTCLYDDETGIYPLVLQFDKSHAFTVLKLINYLDGSVSRVRKSNETHFDELNMCYTCRVSNCQASFDTSENLDMHLQGPVHEIKVYRCPGSCGQRFSRMGTLLRHIEDTTVCRMDFVRGDGGMADLKTFVNEALRSGC